MLSDEQDNTDLRSRLRTKDNPFAVISSFPFCYLFVSIFTTPARFWIGPKFYRNPSKDFKPQWKDRNHGRARYIGHLCGI